MCNPARSRNARTLKKIHAQPYTGRIARGDLRLSVLYWLRIPTAGIAVATVWLLAACLLYATAGA
jgi:hypothetical protein